MIGIKRSLLALGLLAGFLPTHASWASWHENAPAFGGLMRDFAILRNPRPAPDYAFSGPSGERLTFDDFRGKVVLLNFWAIWCPPCVKEMPSLDRLQGKLGGDRFEVLALSLDDSRYIVNKFFAEFGIDNLAIYMDIGENAMQVFAVGGLPTSLIIGPEGNLLGGLAGPAEWDSAEAEALMSYFMAGAEQRAN